MRITDSMVYTQSLFQLQQQYAAVAKASTQVSTGERNANVSDDPAAAATVLSIDAQSRGITQYQRNISAGNARLSGEESTLDQITDILTRAKQLGTEEASDTSDAADRANAALEVQQLVSQVISLGNLKIGDAYVFGGNQTATEPFQADGTYVGDTGVQQIEVGASDDVPANHNGQQLLVDSGVISSLQGLATAMQSGDGSAIGTALTAIDQAQDATQANLTQVGGWEDALSDQTNYLTTRQTSLTSERSDAADIPTDEASLDLATTQAALQAGLLATSKVLQTSLVNYLPTSTP